MPVTLAFDIYGTLIDTHGVVGALAQRIGDRAGPFSRMWRDKQLEYTFRRGLMQTYEDFSVCTRHALDYTCACMKIALSEADKLALMQAYATLPAFDDVASGLARARDAGFRLFAFSNGRADAVETVLTHAGIRDYFEDVVSVDEIHCFKPSPVVYRHFLSRAGAVASATWLISSNPFDVLGAMSAGWRAAWIKRQPDAVFDPWGIEPTLALGSVSDVAGQIIAASSDY